MASGFAGSGRHNSRMETNHDVWGVPCFSLSCAWNLVSAGPAGESPAGKGPVATFGPASYIRVICHTHGFVFRRMRQLVPFQLDRGRNEQQQLYWLGNHRRIVVAAAAGGIACVVAGDAAQEGNLTTPRSARATLNRHLPRHCV